MFNHRSLIHLGLLSAIVSVCGCQTDPIVGRSRVSGAPITALESVEIARSSDMTLSQPSEVDLVEQLIYHRTLYSQTLAQLRQYYDMHGYAEKVRWVDGEIADVRRIRPYHYLLDSELPRMELSPSESIPEADSLFQKALATARDAGHGIPAVFNQEKMTEALRQFKQLIREYPTSDKIDDAAFYCGEIYKEYYEGMDSVAVRWYELAWTWDPSTPYPARFQAAVVYDYRLHERERALELYRATIASEPNKSNRDWSLARIKQLTEIGPVESQRIEPVRGSHSPAHSSMEQTAQEQPTE